MSATDELRRLLDERGVEYEDKHTELVPGISDWDSTWWHGIAGMEFHAVGDETFGREGCVYINGTYLTPEQAIAATLGGDECEIVSYYEASTRGEVGRDRVKLSCGHIVERHSKYCQECGRKIQKAVKR